MAKANEPVGSVNIRLLVGSEYQTAEVPVVAFVGPLAVHETICDHRLAEAKSAAYSVSHTTTGLGLVNGIQTKKVAITFAEEALGKAQELGLELSVAALPGLHEQPSYASWLEWALAARATTKTRKGFLYE